jgi:hypothetical protein
MDDLGFAGGAFGFAPPPQQQQQQQQQEQGGDPRAIGGLIQGPAAMQGQYALGPPQQQPFGLGAEYRYGAAEVRKPRELEDEDGYRSECWSGSTASESSSDHSPPPSATAFGPMRGGHAGGSDWDLLSEMLLDDALGSATAAGLVPPPQVARAQFLPYTQHHMQQQQQLPMSTSWPQQQVVDYNQRFRPFEVPVEPPMPVSAQALGVQVALGGSGSPPSLPPIQTPPQLADTSISPLQRHRTAAATVRQKKKRASAKKQPAAPSPPHSSPQMTPGHHSPSPMSSSSSSSVSGSPVSSSAAAMATSPPTDTTLSVEEMKKLRRRTQIASSVQRHREKKKCVVSALKTELSGLTAQLEELRAQRKDMHADARLVEWEETAVTQRRKRKQSEELNARMKKALFQQTAFLMGMRGLLGSAGEPLAPSEMEFHDWIHSYTILSARGEESRRRELLAHFSESKMDLAKKLVLRETDPIMPRLNRMTPYYANTRVLHDGTRQFVTEPDHDAFVIKQEIVALRTPVSEHEAGDGRVLKKFTSVFLFEESATITLERLHNLVFESTKGVGIYWPAEGYAPRQFNHAPVPMSSPSCSSNVFYTDMTASMSVMDDLLVGQPGSIDAADERDIFVEARVLCRETRDEHEGLIVWDYVDRDDQSGSSGDDDAATAARKQRAIRRNCCGSVVIKREPGGLLSVRSISVKMFAPDSAASKKETRVPDAKARVDDAEEEQLRALFRRIGLQATEAERSKEKCTRFVYNALQAGLAADA